MMNINNNNNINLQNISTEDLLKELESRGYKIPSIKKSIAKNQSTSSKQIKSQEPIKLTIDCKKIFEEKTQQELVIFLQGFTKQEINEFYNQILGKVSKLSGSKQDFVDVIIGFKRATSAGKAFNKWV